MEDVFLTNLQIEVPELRQIPASSGGEMGTHLLQSHYAVSECVYV